VHHPVVPLAALTPTLQTRRFGFDGKDAFLFRPNSDLGDQEQGPDLVAKFSETVAEVGFHLLEGYEGIGEGELAVKVDA
jgi:hypothetical protein